MNHYLDIELLEDPEFNENILMNALFSKLHRALVAIKSNEIGISFPKLKESQEDQKKQKSLGNRMRLHGTQSVLEKFMSEPWLKGLTDHIQQGSIRPVPTHVTVRYRTVTRVQVKSSVERLRRRSIANGRLTPEQAEKKIPMSRQKTSTLPFLRVNSASTGQKFQLFIDHKPIQDQPNTGHFNTYGLSQFATIPWWQS